MGRCYGCKIAAKLAVFVHPVKDEQRSEAAGQRQWRSWGVPPGPLALFPGEGHFAKGAGGRVFRSYALVPHAYRCTPSRGSAAAWAKVEAKVEIEGPAPMGVLPFLENYSRTHNIYPPVCSAK